MYLQVPLNPTRMEDAQHLVAGIQHLLGLRPYLRNLSDIRLDPNPIQANEIFYVDFNVLCIKPIQSYSYVVESN